MHWKTPIAGCAWLITAVFVLACSIGGEVVKVTTIEKGSYDELDEKERKKLEEIRKLSSQKQLDSNISDAIENTAQFTVTEYLRQSPHRIGPKAEDYRIGGYDVLNIVVYEEADLSREAVRVSADGYISFPLINRLNVDGLTTSEVETLISLKLAQGQYLLDAHVSVMVAEYNSKRFMVLGAVNQPGSFALEAQERIIDAISKAGGIRRQAFEDRYHAPGAGKKAMIIRTENSNTAAEKRIVINLDLQGLLKMGNQKANLLLADKDVLYIPPAEHFYVIGQVRHTGAFSIMDEEITLVEAISMAGGFTPIASRNKTRIIRVENGVEKIIEVKVDAITGSGKKISDVVIQPDDVIFVPESFF
jgi:polysaccharide export outer membrane protein